MSINWQQHGQDFQQKYEGTYCRYTSPLNGKCEVFSLTSVEVHPASPPDLTLFSPKYGEIFLKYTTEAELDFTFPEIGYFSHEGKALRFMRNFERQWRKGICGGTSRVVFPYDQLYEVWFPGITHEILESAFKPFERKSISGALLTLDNSTNVESEPLTKTLALGVGIKDEDRLLWFENEPIGELKGNNILLHVQDFRQEITDYLRDTGDYVRQIV